MEYSASKSSVLFEARFAPPQPAPATQPLPPDSEPRQTGDAAKIKLHHNSRHHPFIAIDTTHPALIRTGRHLN
ncbi:hypothetical protein MY5147_005086 [Beauveria neobassiana]|uniref:Uncharacterized protein n=1 Tax=Beauveria bassiana D1-5 TaxID=1245745 RepID=A0A0A2VLC7_BEABA|nr:hypothetical protein BBAD15_g7575 [Beauveria bassiana D1-5]